MTEAVWDDRPTRERRFGLGVWIAASVAAHVLLVVWVLAARWSPMSWVSPDETREIDLRPIDVVQLPNDVPAVPRPPDPEVDRPALGMPPARRTEIQAGPLRPSPAIPPALGVEPFDPRQLERLVNRVQEQERAAEALSGGSFRDCSLLSPERRALEPGCDGAMLAYSSRTARGFAFVAPAGEAAATIAAQNAQAAFERRREERPPTDGPDAENAAIRNDADDRFGPRPWE